MLLLLLAILSIRGEAEQIDERAAAALCARYANHQAPIPGDEDPRQYAEQLANGDGVKQDFAAAIHVVCTGEHMADAAKWGMLDHILQMERGDIDEPLDFCDHATSRDGGLLCAARRDDRETPELRARYEAVRKKYGQPLDALRKRADAFIHADTFWVAELTRGGTMYAFAEIDARLDRETKFVELLERYSQQRAGAASAADFKRADEALNHAYGERMAAIEPCTEDCDPDIPAETENLRAAQRAWIAYRDAWIAWYQHRWHGAGPPDALRREIATLLSRERVEELRSN